MKNLLIKVLIAFTAYFLANLIYPNMDIASVLIGIIQASIVFIADVLLTEECVE